MRAPRSQRSSNRSQSSSDAATAPSTSEGAPFDSWSRPRFASAASIGTHIPAQRRIGAVSSRRPDSPVGATPELFRDSACPGRRFFRLPGRRRRFTPPRHGHLSGFRGRTRLLRFVQAGVCRRSSETPARRASSTPSWATLRPGSVIGSRICARSGWSGTSGITDSNANGNPTSPDQAVHTPLDGRATPMITSVHRPGRFLQRAVARLEACPLPRRHP